jgi:hypothetical protein
MVSGSINRVLHIKPVDVTTTKVLVLSLWSIRAGEQVTDFTSSAKPSWYFYSLLRVGDIMIEEQAFDSWKGKQTCFPPIAFRPALKFTQRKK